MKRNQKPFGQVLHEVKDAETTKEVFAKAANMEYQSKHSLTGEQKYNLWMTVIVMIGVLAFVSLIFGSLILG